jgi:hypothetical protein
VPQPLQQDLLRQRIRFRVAHELGHTLMYVREPARTPWRRASSTASEEAFCDRFASFLLVPGTVLKRCRTLAKLAEVSRRYDVSLEVVVRAWAEVHRADAALFYWTAEKRRPSVQWSNCRTRRLRAWRAQLCTVLASPLQDGASARSNGVVLLPARRQALATSRPQSSPEIATAAAR